LNEYLDEERTRKADLEYENRQLKEQLRRGGPLAPLTTAEDPADVAAFKREIEELRKESVAQTQVLSARNREREQLYQELEELKLQTMRNGREPSAAINGDHGHEDCEATINELRDRLTEMRIKNQDQRDELDGALRDLEHLEQEKVDAHEDYQVEIDRLQEVIDELVKECDELREAKDEADRVADELDQEIDSLVKEAQEKMTYQEREIRLRDEDLIAMKNDMQDALNKAYLDIESLEETVMNKNARIENLRDQLQDLEEEHARLIQRYDDNIQQGSRIQVQQEVSARELQFLREEADNAALKVADFQAMEKKLLDVQRKLQQESLKVKEMQAKIEIFEADQGKSDSEAEEKLKKQVEDLNEVKSSFTILIFRSLRTQSKRYGN
jgi:chromosome segregation ATPase